MTDLSRRNFLKGIMAAAGVAAVGMPVDMATAVEAPPTALPFAHEAGDIFMKVDDAWRFLGKSSRIEVYREIMELDFTSLSSRNFPPHREFHSFVGPCQIDIEFYSDAEGRLLLHDRFVNRGDADFAFSLGEEICTMDSSLMCGIGVNFEEGDYRFDTVSLGASGPIQISK